MLPLFILLFIVLAALVLFIGGWLPADVVGIMVLAGLALSGLVSPEQAVAGFSSPAVITVLAMFILSAGLTRTGVAYRIGQPLLLFARQGETVLVVILMAASSILSALINTTTVAVILLPATMDLARRSGLPPARLLMPMALGCLLGGPFTGISTPPNILATDALRTAGLTTFEIFDFTPITGALVLSGIVFMVVLGMRLLPRGIAQGVHKNGIETSYEVGTHIFTIELPPTSPLVGRNLAESRLGSALYLTVVGLHRGGELILSPRTQETLHAGDIIIVHGQADQASRFHGSRHLQVEPAGPETGEITRRLITATVRIGKGSPLLARTLVESGLRRDHRVHVLALNSPTGECLGDIRQHRFEEGDRLILQGEHEILESLTDKGLFEPETQLAQDRDETRACELLSLCSLRVPEGSVLAGRNLVESRLGNAFGLTVVGLVRDSNVTCLPAPEETVQAGDLLVIQGLVRDIEIFKGLQELAISEHSSRLAAELESQQVGMTEVLLSPRTTLAGKTLNDLLFRDHYGLSVLAVLRKGQTARAGLQDMPLQFGDALLVYGPRQNLEAVARDDDFLVLDQAAAQAPRLHKAPLAAIIMVAVLLSAILGFVPIAIAALTGVAAMVVGGCLTMEEAYRAIEWKVIFLIAGMLPLGLAIENTGAAQMGAEALIGMVGDLGPRWVVAALFGVTVLGTQVIPTAALVVLMAPVTLGAASQLGISPQLLMMTVAMAASASFASPLSHPAHLLVMGPGGYRFMDYVKVGVPLTVVVMAVSVWLLPILWPA
ncbi:MAG: SLC13 family permease [Desulfovibrionales bacterium]|nr:SLC13 family permease [Desulfovibrionales bacterium]